MTRRIDRRSFLKESGSAAIGATAVTLLGTPAAADAESQSFRSAWPQQERPWAGPEYWTNPLQDWRVRNGRAECFRPGGDRNIFLLTREVAPREGSVSMSVRIGRLEGDNQKLDQGFVGFRVGIKSFLDDYRAWAIHGRGMNAGISADGRLFIGELTEQSPRVSLDKPLLLQFESQPGSKVVLRVSDERGKKLAEISHQVSQDWLTGGLALVCSSGEIQPTPQPISELKDYHFYPPGQQGGGTMRFWFTDWNVGGSRIDAHEDRAYGPILFALYTVSRGVLKLSAQLPPLGDNAPREVRLQIRNGGNRWKTIATAEADPDAWNAVFRVPSWDDGKDHPYRLVYPAPGPDGKIQKQSYEGIIRRDPKDKNDITIALMTCVWDMGFPHLDLTHALGWHKPDLLLWTGDQVYERVGGFGNMETRDPALLIASMQDYLRKWYIFGWATRGLTREIPTICMTDDHDMYHGNLWGCGGRQTSVSLGMGGPAQDAGGYKMPARWVNMAQRTQTAHLPDPFDPAPIEQGITVYYTDLRWGGISFAILEDRKWKSSPTLEMPEAHIVNGFPRDPHWEANKSNVPTAELLGNRQLDFLESWAADWSAGVWMKFAVSQTLFGCLATEPVGDTGDDPDPSLSVLQLGEYTPNDWVMMDHDSGAWPQHGRNAAISKWRKAFAIHLSGDQHLGSTSHYGTEGFRDGVYAVCTPAVSNLWPRRWFPPDQAPNALPGTRNTGDYLDRFGNHMTVLGAANPHQYPGTGLQGLRNRATGYTILRCDRISREVRVALWPRWVDPSLPGAKPFPGWPITVRQLDNGLYRAEWTLGKIETPGHPDSVVRVENESTGDLIYNLRIKGDTFEALVREPGIYTVVAFDPDGGYRRAWRGLQARTRL